MLDVNLDVHFSKRESECVHYLKEGFSSKEIARELGLSCKTIDGYVGNLVAKTNCKNRKRLIAYLYKFF